jgi:hypothetical protein
MRMAFHIAGLAVIAWLALAGAGLAAVNEDVRCVQAFLLTTAFNPGPADGALGRKTVAAAAEFAESAGLAERLPVLSVETATEWCAFAQSDEGLDIAVVASLTVYPIEMDGTDTAGDESGLLPFEFGKHKLTDRYDGYKCGLNVVGDAPNSFATIGLATVTFVDGGHLALTKGLWFGGGLATPDSYGRANIAVTEEGALVGAFEVFNVIVQPGQIPPPAEIVVFKPADGTLGAEKPEGKINMTIPNDTPGAFVLSNCRK